MNHPANNKRSLHILLIHQAFATLNEPGGTRHYEMAQYLAGHGHKVTIITSSVSYLTGKSPTRSTKWVTRESPEEGIEILRSYAYPALHRSFFHRVLGFLSFMFSSFFVGLGVKNVDVVWGTSPPIFQGWTAWLIARLRGVKFLFEIRDLWPAFAIAVGVLKNPLLVFLSQWLEKFLYRHADQLVVNSPGFIDYIKARGGKDILLIPNGVDPEMFDLSDSGEEFREEHDLLSSFNVMYAGAHGMSNDLEVLVSAARLTAPDPHIMYLLIGDGKEKAHLQDLSRSWGLNNILFLPPVAKEQMSRVMAAADLCVAILKPIEMYKTTYPNKVFDYLAAGKPVLCAIDGVIREVIEKAGAGVFVKPGDPTSLSEQIIQLSGSPERLKQMGNNGRVYVEFYFNRRDLAAKMENALKQLSTPLGIPQ